MPKFQGEMDGLCGPYAIVNALEKFGLDPNETFKVACNAPASYRWPDLLWEGTGFGDLQRMIGKCLGSSLNTLGVQARYPFKRNPPKTNESYWKRFDELFSDPINFCGIIGVIQPHLHWIVVSHDGNRVEFTDSNPYRLSYRKNRALLFAGERRQRRGQWLIDRSELVIFSS